MNMFISILNDVLVEVHTDAKLQDNDYEMVDYMIDSVKSKFLILISPGPWWYRIFIVDIPPTYDS